MSNIQRISEPHVHFRSYQYDWETRQLATDTDKTAVQAVYSYRFHGIDRMTLAKLIMLVSLQQSTVYGGLLATCLEDVQTNSEILETATLIAEKLAAMVEGRPSTTLFMGDKVPYLAPSGTLTQVEMKTFLVQYLGLKTSDLPSGVNWHASDCTAALTKLLDIIDSLNRVSGLGEAPPRDLANQLGLWARSGGPASEWEAADAPGG